MADYGQCKYCKYCNTGDKDGYKIYCEWYNSYEDPDEVRECPHFYKY